MQRISSKKKTSSLLAPELLARVKKIHIRTHRLVSTALSGGYRSTFRGQGIEFEEVRPYIPGDDVRKIDWNVTARTGEPFVKTYNEERQLTIHLLVDTGLPMDFGSQRWTKREAAAQLAALVAFVAMQHQDRVGLTLFGDEPGLHLGPKKGSQHVLRLVREMLAAPGSLRASDVGAVLRTQERTLHARSLVFLISDFLSTEFDDAWVEPLARLARRHDVIAARIVDPFEEQLPRAGIVRMQGLLESELREVDTSSAAVRDAWAERARKRRERLQASLVRACVDHFEVDLGGDLAEPLVGFFKRRAARHGRR
ncbi:MAG: DUF58 domain-containing protein [bacterium]|nr:DUF58 domain-containing protein [bacterium]